MPDLKRLLAVLAGVMIVAAFSVVSFVFLHGEGDVAIPESFRNRGRSTSLLLQDAMDQGRLDLPGYVAEHGISSSTELWRQLVRDQMLGMDIDWFMAPGAAPHAGIDVSTFRAEHNAWSLFVRKGTNAVSSAPFLFSSNLQFTNVAGVVRAQLVEHALLGVTAAVVVDAGGQVRTLRASDLETQAWPLVRADLDAMLVP